MSVFRVDGISLHRCREQARKQVKDYEGFGDSRRTLTEAEWLERVEQAAQERFAGGGQNVSDQRGVLDAGDRARICRAGRQGPGVQADHAHEAGQERI